jgi:hypothetical protein
MILYRAAPRKEPYFGRGSYWTPSLNFVKSYRRWAHKTCPVLADRLVEARASEEVLNSARANQDLVLYRAEVQLDADELVDLSKPGDGRFIPVSSTMVTDERIEKFAALGIRWVCFYEPRWRATNSVISTSTAAPSRSPPIDRTTRFCDLRV